ncbi:MAG: NAD(P)H-dependent oxidoreductase subunit E [Sedimentisphaerales bacterium]|nr:NAD(P)H-dependent oxidoreductase subunit E [Sedimentisphaerales bacterium]
MQTTTDQNRQQLIEYINQLPDRPYRDSYLIAVLHKAQELYGYVSRDAMDLISSQMQIPTAHIWGVVTFYHYFRTQPPGRYQISVCLGTACYVKGAAEVLQAFKDRLGVEAGQITEDGLFSLLEARCLGACGLAPVCMINDKVYGQLNPDKVGRIINDLRKAAR